MPTKLNIVLVLDSIRSLYNVGAILRLCDGLGVSTVFACGITPYTRQPKDTRLPHVIKKAEHMISKTALGAEKNVRLIYHQDCLDLIKKLKKRNFKIISLEQTKESLSLISYQPQVDKLAIVLGSEIGGVTESVLNLSDYIIEIPMNNEKKSFNVATAAAIALFHITNTTQRKIKNSL